MREQFARERQDDADVGVDQRGGLDSGEPDEGIDGSERARPHDPPPR